MNTIKNFLDATNYRITGGSEYGWSCFGPNARYLDCDDSEGADGAFSVHTIFDSVNQEVYIIEAWDYVTDREYRWMNPEFRPKFIAESKSRNISSSESLDGRNYIELEVVEDILEKIKCIVAGTEYDTRVKVPLTLDKEQMYELMCMAHEKDITLNELVEEVLLEQIGRFENGI
jgi:hypothetical protein